MTEEDLAELSALTERIDALENAARLFATSTQASQASAEATLRVVNANERLSVANDRLLAAIVRHSAATSQLVAAMAASENPADRAKLLVSIRERFNELDTYLKDFDQRTQEARDDATAE